MFTLNAFSLDVICFLCYSSFSMVQALRDSDEYFSKKFLCWSVCRLHNEYKLTKCEILLPTKLTRLWLSERSVRCPSVLRAELNLWLLITSLGLLTLGIYRTFFILLFGMKSLGRMDGDSSITVSERYRRRVGGLRKARFTPTGSARIVSDWLAHFHCDAQ